MKFCPSCETKLVLKSGKDAAILYRCNKCDYEKTGLFRPKNLIRSRSEKSEAVVVINEDDQRLETTPTTVVHCSNCDSNLAKVWQVQTRSGDEGATQFYRCVKCNHTWRLYT